MLDLLEWLGLDLDSLDGGGSCDIQQWIWPGTDPQSVCSYLYHRRRWVLVFMVGTRHSRRSWQRYHPERHQGGE